MLMYRIRERMYMFCTLNRSVTDRVIRIIYRRPRNTHACMDTSQSHAYVPDTGAHVHVLHIEPLRNGQGNTYHLS